MNARVRFGSRRRSRAYCLVVGASSVSIDQSMTWSRDELKNGGSLPSDWRAVGRDIAGAIKSVKRDLEPA